MQERELLPGEQEYFLPDSGTFDETLFLRLPALVGHVALVRAGMNMAGILRNNVSRFVPDSEAAEAFRKWRGIGKKGHFCI